MVKGDFQQAKLNLVLAPKAGLDLKKLRKAVEKAGYTASWIRFKATGSLVEKSGHYCFRMKGSGQTIALIKDKGLDRLLSALDSHRPGSAEIEITGLFKRGSGAAVVEDFKLK